MCPFSRFGYQRLTAFPSAGLLEQKYILNDQRLLLYQRFQRLQKFNAGRFLNWDSNNYWIPIKFPSELWNYESNSTVLQIQYYKRCKGFLRSVDDLNIEVLWTERCAFVIFVAVRKNLVLRWRWTAKQWLKCILMYKIILGNNSILVKKQMKQNCYYQSYCLKIH